MTNLSRRTLLLSLLAATALPAFDQQSWAQQQNSVPTPNPFRYEDVVRRARELAGVPFEAPVSQLPEPLNRLSFDDYRDIRFRTDKALLGGGGGPFRHAALPSRLPLPAPGDGERHPRRRADPGGLSAGAVRLRPQQDRAAAAGQSRLCRLSPPLSPERSEGAGRAHRLPRRELFPLPRARTRNTASRRAGLAINVEGGEAEEFPHFREFWIEMPKPNDERAIIYALLDSPSVAGAYRFEIYPSKETTLDITATLFPRQPITNVGVAPLTSMYFEGENDRKPYRRFPARAARFGRAAHAVRAPASGSGAPAQSGQEDDLLLQRQQPARLRPDAARPGVRELPGSGGASTISAPATGSSPSANGARAGSSWSRSRRRTRPTTTSSPIGSRAGPTSRARKSSSPTACAPRRRSARCIRAERWSTPSRRRPGPAGRTRRAIPGIAASSSISRAATWPIT